MYAVSRGIEEKYSDDSIVLFEMIFFTITLHYHYIPTPLALEINRRKIIYYTD